MLSKIGRWCAPAVLGLAAAAFVGGCATADELGKWDGPAAPAASELKEWQFGEERAKLIESKHYRIYTTINDDETLALLPQVMEGALAMYHQIAPNIPQSPRHMDCFVFRARSEWDQYTQRYTGRDAAVYLQIRSGGYTIQDRYVAYYIGRLGTFSVAAHEGWHQFAGRHFKGRLPPFFEEGMACMFETISWNKTLPRWNLSVNTQRAATLKKAVEGKFLWPLEQLCAMHAGDIVGEDGDKIDAFYAQSWAFARFLWEGEDGRHRPAMQKWLSETAAGTVFDPTHSHRRALAPWNRRAVKPMIEHYVGMPMKDIAVAYEAYVRKIAYEELGAQYRSNAN